MEVVPEDEELCSDILQNSRKFDAVDTESIDSGRTSRRGISREGMDYEFEDDTSSIDSQADLESKGDHSSIASSKSNKSKGRSSGWKKIQTLTKLRKSSNSNSNTEVHNTGNEVNNSQSEISQSNGNTVAVRDGDEQMSDNGKSSGLKKLKALTNACKRNTRNETVTTTKDVDTMQRRSQSACSKGNDDTTRATSHQVSSAMVPSHVRVVSATGTALVLDSGYRDSASVVTNDPDLQSQTQDRLCEPDDASERWADGSNLHDNEEYDNRSIVSSRQDGQMDDGDGECCSDTGLRACKSATDMGRWGGQISQESDISAKRHNSFHKSISSPSLVKPKEKRRSKTPVDYPQATITRTSSISSCGQTPVSPRKEAFEHQNETGMVERLPGTASRRFRDVAVALSAAKGIGKLMSQRQEDSTSGKSTRSNAKTVSWKDSGKSLNAISIDGSRSSLEKPRSKKSGSSRRSADRTSTPTKDDNSDTVTSTGIPSSPTSLSSGHDKSEPVTRETPDIEKPNLETRASFNQSQVRLSPFGNPRCVSTPDNVSLHSNASTISVKDTLTDMFNIIGGLRNERPDGNTGLLTVSRIEKYREQFQLATLAMKKCERVSTKICDTLSAMREQLIDVKTELMGDLSGMSISSSSGYQENYVERSSEFRQAVAKTMMDLSEAIKAAAVAETVALGTSLDAGDTIALTSQVSGNLDHLQVEESDSEGDNCSEATTDLYETVMIDVIDEDYCSNVDGSRSRLSSGELDDTASSERQIAQSMDDSFISESVASEFSTAESMTYYTNWPQHVCTSASYHGEESLTCIVHVNPAMVNLTNLTCEVRDPTSLPSITDEFETLVGRPVRLTSTDVDPMSSQSCFLVALPYREAMVVPWQDVVVRQLTESGQWRELPTMPYKSSLPDDMSHLSYVEAETDGLCTLVVVARAKIDILQFDAEGGTLTSSADSETSVTIQENSLFGEGQLVFQAIPLDPYFMHDYTLLDDGDRKIQGASPIIDIHFSDDVRKPKTISVPIIAPQRRPLRNNCTFSSGSTRPAVSPDPFDEDSLCVFQHKQPTGWRGVKYMRVQNIADTPGMVTFDWFDKEGRVAVIHMSKEIVRSTMDAVGSDFLNYMKQTPVEYTVVQVPDCARKLSVSLAPKQYRVPPRRSSRKDNYDHITVKEIMQQEGQSYAINLRGNLGASCKFPKHYLYYSIETLKFDCEMHVLDRFAQRSLVDFCGFMQILEKSESGSRTIMDECPTNLAENSEKRRVVTEICVKFPKSDLQPLPPLIRAPLDIKLTGGVSYEILREVALQLDGEWKQLARILRMPHARMQSILRNTRDKPSEHVVLEVLLSWIKRVPVSQDKAQLLCDVLQKCGRPDLVIDIKERDRRQKFLEAQKARAYNLQKATMIVCRSPTAVRQWKALALGLGLSIDDVTALEYLPLNQEDACRLALERWLSTTDLSANLSDLARELSSVGCIHVAELIMSAYGSGT